jgi:hypothetical protein
MQFNVWKIQVTNIFERKAECLHDFQNDVLNIDIFQNFYLIISSILIWEMLKHAIIASINFKNSSCKMNELLIAGC